MTLTKNGIAEEIAKIGYSKEKSFQITETLIEIIKGLSSDKEVLISGFAIYRQIQTIQTWQESGIWREYYIIWPTSCWI